MKRQGISVEYCHIYLSDYLDKEPILPSMLPEIRAVKTFVDYLSGRYEDIALNVLVDNYFPHEINEYDPVGIFEMLRDFGLAPDFIFLEGDMKQYADHLISNLHGDSLQERKDRLYLAERSTRKQDMRVSISSRESVDYAVLLTNVDNQHQGRDLGETVHEYEFYLTDVLLKYRRAGTIVYSCPLLASVWYLARLGIAPYSRIAEKGYRYSDRAFFAERLLTIVSADYLKVEAASRSILKTVGNPEVQEALESGCFQYYII